jgi:hypothetical protein
MYANTSFTRTPTNKNKATKPWNPETAKALLGGEENLKHFTEFVMLVDTLHDIMERQELKALFKELSRKAGFPADSPITTGEFPPLTVNGKTKPPPIGNYEFFRFFRSLAYMHGIGPYDRRNLRDPKGQRLTKLLQWLFDSGLMVNEAGNSKNFIAPMTDIKNVKIRIIAFINDNIVRVSDQRSPDAYTMFVLGRLEMQQWIQQRTFAVDAGYTIDIHRLIGASLKHKNMGKTKGSKLMGEEKYVGGVSQLLNSASTLQITGKEVNASVVNNQIKPANKAKLFRPGQNTIDLLVKSLTMGQNKFMGFRQFGEYKQMDGALKFYVRQGITVSQIPSNDVLVIESNTSNAIFPRIRVFLVTATQKKNETPYTLTHFQNDIVEFVYFCGKTLQGPAAEKVFEMVVPIERAALRTGGLSAAQYSDIIIKFANIKRGGDGFQSYENALLNIQLASLGKPPTYLVTGDITALAIGIINGACMALAMSEGTYLIYTPTYIEKNTAQSTYKTYRNQANKFIKKHLLNTSTPMGSMVNALVKDIKDKKGDSAAFVMSSIMDKINNAIVNRHFKNHSNNLSTLLKNARGNSTAQAELKEFVRLLSHPAGAFYFSALENQPTPMEVGNSKENTNTNRVNTAPFNVAPKPAATNNTVANRVKARRRVIEAAPNGNNIKPGGKRLRSASS